MYQFTFPTFTRPANATPYTAGDLVANDTTPASVTPLLYSRVGGGPSVINKFTLVHSQRTTTNASWQVFVVDAQNALALGVGDNAPLMTAGATATLDMTRVRAIYAGNSVAIGPTGGYAELVPAAAGSQIILVPPVQMLLIANGGYTPASGETFTLSMDLGPRAP